MNDNIIKGILIASNVVLLLWCVALTGYQIIYRPADIAQLSVRQLFEDFLSEQSTNTDPVKIEANTANYSRELDNILKELSARNNVVILVSEAVLSDHVLDITPEIKVVLERRLRERPSLGPAKQAERMDD